MELLSLIGLIVITMLYIIITKLTNVNSTLTAQLRELQKFKEQMQADLKTASVSQPHNETSQENVTSSSLNSDRSFDIQPNAEHSDEMRWLPESEQVSHAAEPNAHASMNLNDAIDRGLQTKSKKQHLLQAQSESLITPVYEQQHDHEILPAEPIVATADSESTESLLTATEQSHEQTATTKDQINMESVVSEALITTETVENILVESITEVASAEAVTIEEHPIPLTEKTKPEEPLSVWNTDDTISLPAEKSESSLVSWWKYLEQQFAARWMVWIGGAIMALGVIFLVKIGNDHGLFGPKLRIGLAAVLGATMTIGGELLRRSRFQLNIASGQYIPAALSGAGIIALYASMLGANYVYDMFPLGVLFAILAVISAVAMVLALYQGPFMAALGIVGAYMVPLFISTGSGNVTGLLIYVAIVTAGSLVLLNNIYRRWLWWGALAGNYFWLLLSILFINPDAHYIAKSVFLVITTYGFFALPHFGWQLRPFKSEKVLQTFTIARQDGLLTGIVAAFMLILSAQHSPADICLWLTIWAVCAGLLFIARRIPELNLLSITGAVTLLMTLAVLMSSQVSIQMPTRLDTQLALNFHVNAFIFLGALFCFGSLAILYGLFACQSAQQTDKTKNTLIWSLISTIVPIITLFTLHQIFPVEWQSIAHYLADPAVIIIAIVTGALWYRVVMNDITQNNVIQMVYTVAANIIVAIALSLVFKQTQLTVLLAIQMLVSAALIKWKAQPVSEWVFKGLMLLILLRLSFNPTIFIYDQNILAIPWTIYGYGIPVLCSWLVLRWLSDQERYQKTAQLAQINMIYLLGLWANIELRHTLHGSYHISLNFNSLTDVSLHALTFGGMALAYLYKAPISGIGFIYKIAAKVFGSAALLLTIIGSLIVYNPLISAQSVGSLPLLNLVTAAYGIPAIMLLILVNFWPNSLRVQYRRYAAILAGLLGMLFITLTVRQLWHGPLLNQPFVYVGEQYFYSFAWMITAIIMMTLAIKKQHLILRRASLALLFLTIIKLFVWDMSGLTGFYRPISFIGLGLCLVGVGWFYQKFVIQDEHNKPIADADADADAEQDTVLTGTEATEYDEEPFNKTADETPLTK